MKIKLWINEKMYEDHIEPDLMLIDYLRDKGFKSVKCGCDTTNCGLCTVYMDGKTVLSCAVPAVRASGHRITTLEGMAKEAEEFARFMAAQGAEQCGYCSPGLIMNVLAMAKELKNPTEQEIKEYLAGNLCRCTGYEGQYRAIRNYLGATQADYQLFGKGEVIEGVR